MEKIKKVIHPNENFRELLSLKYIYAIKKSYWSNMLQ